MYCSFREVSLTGPFLAGLDFGSGNCTLSDEISSCDSSRKSSDVCGFAIALVFL